MSSKSQPCRSIYRIAKVFPQHQPLALHGKKIVSVSAFEQEADSLVVGFVFSKGFFDNIVVVLGCRIHTVCGYESAPAQNIKNFLGANRLALPRVDQRIFYVIVFLKFFGNVQFIEEIRCDLAEYGEPFFIIHFKSTIVLQNELV